MAAFRGGGTASQLRTICKAAEPILAIDMMGTVLDAHAGSGPYSSGALFHSLPSAGAKK